MKLKTTDGVNDMADLRLGIDIGGTNTKYCVINENGSIIFRNEKETVKSHCNLLIKEIAGICIEIMKTYPINKIGMGVPGSVINGIVDTDNLPLKKIEFSKRIESLIKFPISVANDADCAALAESIYGVGKNYRNLVLITIGTGIGGGIIINKNVYHGRGMAGEIGHMCLDVNGIKCGCGRRGCFEKYASATALIESAKNFVKDNHNNILYELYLKNNSVMNGKVFFNALKEKCDAASKIFDEYIGFLAVGINNIINILDPDIIILSGGITNAGDIISDKIEKALNCKTTIKVSVLRNDAGMIGASLIE